MINTYQTSLAPPPVPPRHNRPQPVLIPAPLSLQGHHSRPLIRFLVCVVVLHLILSVGGFIYLYQLEKTKKVGSTEGGVGYISSGKQDTTYKALAGMVVDRQTRSQTTPGYLKWDMKHSVRKNINYYYDSWLTVLHSGEYFVYSTVTFSKSLPNSLPTNRIMLRKSKTDKDTAVMKSYCSLNSRTGNASAPRLCTASQGEVIRLEEGNQLSVWVEDPSIVDYEEGATTFGMYKL